MKLPPFTLVHDPRARKPRQWKRLVEERLPGIDSEIRRSLGSVKLALASTLLDSFGVSTDESEVLRKVVGELERHPQVVVVGLWDLSSQVGELPAIIEYLNEAQPRIALFEVQASVPAGFVSRPERLIERIRKRKPSTDVRLSDCDSNVLFEDFASRAERVRKDLGIDYLIGITPYMVAFEDSTGVHWNYFSCSWERVVLASTYDVDRYARRAKRPFEAAVAAIAVSQLLAAMNPRIEYHPDSRGCIFDKNESRDGIVKALEAGNIDDECMKLLEPHYRDTALSLVEALRKYPGRGDRT